MPSWSELTNILTTIPKEKSLEWVKDEQDKCFREISALREGRNVIFYASGFLQKPGVHPAWLQITYEEVNGLMAALHGMKCDNGLTLILHTPGGITTATESFVSYLHKKFKYIEVIVPTYAMSAGTMICLSSHKVIMGKQSQLGPIDPQMQLRDIFVSASAVVEQFKLAKKEILKNTDAAHLWAPILTSLGPSLLQECQNAISYSERMVEKWLMKVVPRQKAMRIAKYFNDAGEHKSHGRRIDRDEARKQGLDIEDLENDQKLQEAVLTLYHLATIVFERTPTTKFILTSTGKNWIKNWNVIGK